MDPICARGVRLNGVLQYDDEVLLSFAGPGADGMIDLRVEEPQIRERTVEVAERWKSDGTPLATFVSVEHELVGLVDETTGHALAGLLTGLDD